MIKIVGLVLTLVGFVGLILGVLGIFGKELVALHPWALAILGIIFFGAGVGLLKRKSADG